MKATGIFSYLNKLPEISKLRSKAKSPKDFLDISVVEEALLVRTAH